MDKPSFSKLISDIYMYFDRQKLPPVEQIRLWYEDLRWIPASAINDILTAFKELDNLPRNIPKAIKSANGRFRRSNPMLKQYDPINDPTYPVDKLYIALGILERKGHDEFMKYCMAVRMPSEDIERVRNKYRYCHPDIEALTDGMLKDA